MQNRFIPTVRGVYQVMVATDIAARGINVEGISHVFNYDVPVFPEDYVHRIGRTGRAEATGEAITFVSYDEIPHIRNIERFIGQRFKEEYYEGFGYKERLSLDKGPTSSEVNKNKKTGSSQRNRMKAKRGGRGGESNQKSSAVATLQKVSPARQEEKVKAKEKAATPGANAKKSFKRKGRSKYSCQATNASFKRTRKRGAKKKAISTSTK
jgi:ATP-dependent RNA helicase RhlE